MPSTTKINTATQVKGLILSLSDEQTNVAHVLDGKNFDFIGSGPRSGFGASVVSMQAIQNRDCHPTTFLQENCSLFFNEKGVFNIDCDGNFIELFGFRECQNKCKFDPCCYQWSQAYVGDVYYYSHPKIGIVEYDTYTQKWCQWNLADKRITSCVYGIAEQDNRLIILGSDTYSISAIDNGRDVIPDHLSTAAITSLSIGEFGQPIGVYSGKFGFFTFTSTAILYSQPTQDRDILFNVSVFKKHDSPISPSAITQRQDGLIYYFTKRGLMTLGRFENNQFNTGAVDADISEFIQKKIFNCIDKCDCNAVKLSYLDDREQLFISFKELNLCGNGNKTKSDCYSRALVYHTDYQEIGSFDQPHISIVHTAFSEEYNKVNNNGYIDCNGFIMEFNGLNYIENPQEYSAGTLYAHRPLNSYIDIGVFTMPDSKNIDKTSTINDISVTTSSAKIDYNNCDDFINWQKLCEQNSEYSIQICSGLSADDINCCSPVYYSKSSPSTSYYTCNNNGIYHKVRLSAFELGQYFELKTIKLATIAEGES